MRKRLSNFSASSCETKHSQTCPSISAAKLRGVPFACRMPSFKIKISSATDSTSETICVDKMIILSLDR